jgi:hypothetical protein
LRDSKAPLKAKSDSRYSRVATANHRHRHGIVHRYHID